MVKLRMAQHIGDAAKFVEQGRIFLYLVCQHSYSSVITILLIYSNKVIHQPTVLD